MKRSLFRLMSSHVRDDQLKTQLMYDLQQRNIINTFENGVLLCEFLKNFYELHQLKFNKHPKNTFEMMNNFETALNLLKQHEIKQTGAMQFLNLLAPVDFISKSEDLVFNVLWLLFKRHDQFQEYVYFQLKIILRDWMLNEQLIYYSISKKQLSKIEQQQQQQRHHTDNNFRMMIIVALIDSISNCPFSQELIKYSDFVDDVVILRDLPWYRYTDDLTHSRVTIQQELEQKQFFWRVIQFAEEKFQFESFFTKYYLLDDVDSAEQKTSFHFKRHFQFSRVVRF